MTINVAGLITTHDAERASSRAPDAASPGDPVAMNGRQARIVERVEQHGFVMIETLARELAVSPQTVRRDLIRLDELGVLQRFHGGAGRRGSGERASHEAKRARQADLKLRIAEAMAAEVREGDALFLDVGTTTEAVARALLRFERLIVVTPSASVASILVARGITLPGSHISGIEVVITGGRVVGADLSLAGPVALRTLRDYRFDWAIISCSAIDATGTALDFDADKVALKQAAMAVAGRKALVADSAKFSRSALLRLGELDEFDRLVTDAPLAPSLAQRLRAGALTLA